MNAHVDDDNVVRVIDLFVKSLNMPEPTFYPKPMFYDKGSLMPNPFIFKRILQGFAASVGQCSGQSPAPRTQAAAAFPLNRLGKYNQFE